MNLAPLTDRSFSAERPKGMTAEEFILQYLDKNHVPIIMELAVKHNLTIEKAVAFALAMFFSIEDLMYYQYSFEVPGFSVKATKPLQHAKIITGWKRKYRSYEYDPTTIMVCRKFLVNAQRKDEHNPRVYINREKEAAEKRLKGKCKSMLFRMRNLGSNDKFMAKLEEKRDYNKRRWKIFAEQRLQAFKDGIIKDYQGVTPENIMSIINNNKKNTK